MSSADGPVSPTESDHPYRTFFVPFCIFTALGVFHFTPGLWSVPEKIPGILGDSYYSLWSFWWFQEALTTLSNPYFTEYLHQPHGVWLWFQQMSIFNAVLSVPLQLVLSLNTSYAAVLFSSFVATGMSVFYLVRRVVGSRLSALVGALSFVYSDLYLAHTYNHVQFAAFQWIPLFILFLLRADERGSGWDAGGSALFLALASLCTWYQGMFGFLFLGLYLIRSCFENWKPSLDFQRIGRIVMIGAVTLLMLSPIVLPMIWWQVTGQVSGGHNPVEWSADLLRYFVPGEFASLGKWLYGPNLDLPGKGGVERMVFLGWITLGLAMYGSRRRESRLWQVAFVVFFLLSLGPQLKLFGILTVIPMPYGFLQHVMPFISMAGMPVRFALMAQLFLAVLVGFGCRELLTGIGGTDFENAIWERPSRAVRKNCRALISVLMGFLLLSGGLVASHATGDYPSFRQRGEGAYRWLANQGNTAIILDLSWPTRSASLYNQTIHETPIIDGPLSRFPKKNRKFLRRSTVLKTLLFNRKASMEQIKKRVFPEVRQVFRRLNVRFVVIHSPKLIRLFKETYSHEAVYEDNEAVVFPGKNSVVH